MGSQYVLSFAYTKNPSPQNPGYPNFVASADIDITGQPTWRLDTPATINSYTDLNWQHTSVVFTATSPTTTLQFSSLNSGSGGMLLDTIKIAKETSNYAYLTFTEDTNLTTTPIKFAVPPFVPDTTTSNVFTDDFEQTPAGDYSSGAQFGNGWTVTSNQVSVITDPANAYAGSKFLALASGTVFTNLPTLAGKTYTLTFAYRGPGIAGWWRGEGNTVDSINGNNGTLVNGTTYTSGEVGATFAVNGTNQYVQIPQSPSLDLTGNQVTVEFWMRGNPNNAMGVYQGLVTSDFYLVSIDIGNPPTGPGIDFDISSNGGISWAQTSNANGIGANVPPGEWHHVAGVYDGTKVQLYIDGQPFGNPFLHTGNISAMQPGHFLTIGSEAGRGVSGRNFNGQIDEASVYNRALSESEINAIYRRGTSGKFDPVVFNTSPAQSLAEAQISLGNAAPTTILGDNTTWQTKTVTFTATQNGTPLSITGLEPGMLLDNFTLTQEPGNLYYLPEQSLDAFNGQSAYGDWQLEIQDDRAGAGLTNALLSWDLQFVFADTNAVPLVVTGGTGLTNQFIPSGYTAWYQINVPAGVNFATNRLLFASAPLSMWFDTNNPPTTNILFLPNAIYPSGTSGSVLLSTTNPPNGNLQPPPNIYNDQTYYLGVQNLNTFTVNYGIEVDFDTSLFFHFLATPPDVTMDEMTTLVLTNAATNAVGTITYALTNSPAWASIDPLTGVITLTPGEADGPGTNIIATLATDSGPPSSTISNSFQVIVREVNRPPDFVYPTNGAVISIPATIPFTTDCVATDPDIPVNPLTFALVSGPPGLTVTTNGVIDWTPPYTTVPTTNTVSISVTDTNIYALINRSYSVTNTFTIIVTVTNTPPRLPAQNNANIDELTTLMVTNTATDAESPPQILSYMVGMAVDTNAMNLNGWPLTYAGTVPSPAISLNGIITWTPGESQGPGVYIITTVVTDDGLPPLSASNSFQVTVKEVNLAPFWPTNVPSQTNYDISATTTLVVTNTAMDRIFPRIR